MREYPIRVGSMLFTMVDPHRGYEIEYNRWYERDHFYAGCLIGPWLFSGGRWVATRPLKDLRFPADSPVADPVDAGSYLAVYWVLEGKHGEHFSWATDQVKSLYADGRGFDNRTHIHTALYNHDWRQYRDEDPVPLELSLDHAFGGLVAVSVEREQGVTKEQVDSWYQQELLPSWLPGSPVASVSSWSQVPLRGDAPSFVPRDEGADRRSMHLYFLDTDPRGAWDRFVELGKAVSGSGLGHAALAAPFIPTVVGTDTYVDELW